MARTSHSVWSNAPSNIFSKVTPARAKLMLLIKTQNRQAAFDLPLSQDLLVQLTLEASVCGQTIADISGKTVSQVMEKDLVGEILRNSKNKVADCLAPMALLPQSMKEYTAGLSVRFFKVTTATWKNRVTKSTGNTLSVNWSALNSTGSDAIKRSVAIKLRR
jgi:hypothetical protein